MYKITVTPVRTGQPEVICGGFWSKSRQAADYKCENGNKR